MAPFQPQERLRHLKPPYDVVVVGGGIYGATVAWEAVSRGLSVLLMESRDFGSGTSANSLKTIHGGLRSLQRLDFREMREYIRERRALLRIAPHLIVPMPCVIPTFPPLSQSKLLLGTGLKLYDLIAWDRNNGLCDSRYIPPGQVISRKRLIELAPGFGDSSATGGVRWADAQAHNSERLVLAFVMAAREAGATVFNYMKKQEYIVNQGKVCGVIAKDGLTGREVEVAARAVIDCTGSWAVQDRLFVNSTGMSIPEVTVRGVNLVVKRKLSACALGVRPLTGLEDSKRLLFIVPWRQGSIVGTWYYPEAADFDHLELTEVELSNCLVQINSVFPSPGLKREDVTLIHCGLLPANAGKQEGDEPHLWSHAGIVSSESGRGPRGIYWVQGVKLTTARATAVKVLGQVARYLNSPVTASRTCETALYGAGFADYHAYEQCCYKKLSGHWSMEIVTRLLRNYGSNLDAILDICRQEQSLAQLIPGTTDTLRAELRYILENEMVCTLSDLMLRRTDIGSFACPGEDTIEYCADVMAQYQEWDTTQRRENINTLLQCYPEWCRC